MKELIPYAASVAAFFLIFNLFYTVAPYPIAIVTIEDVVKFAPEAYTVGGDEPEKIVATASTWKGYRVIEYWYYWPYDGYEKKDDWEPIIVLVDGDTVKAVAHRIHYNWRVSYAFPEGENGTPIVTFLYLWHTPMLREPGSGYVKVDVRPTIGEPPEEVDYGKVFGYGFLPTESALAAALIYASVFSALTFVLTRSIVRAVSVE